MKKEDFSKLMKHDLVVLKDRTKVMVVQAAKLAAWNSGKQTGVLVICKVLKAFDPSKAGSTVEVALRSAVRPKKGKNIFLDKMILNEGVKNKFEVVKTDLFQKPTSKELIKSVDPSVITECDNEAISSPKSFLLNYCGYRWLPSHGHHNQGKTISVRDRYEKWKNKKNDAQEKGLSESGGMRALLEFRSWETERIIDQVRKLTYTYSKNAREITVSNYEVEKEKKDSFIGEVKTLGGDAPGSTTPTSDIDVNTYGDGTEYAVRMFNSIFKSYYPPEEAGIVFDVNVYGKDFLPRFDNFTPRKKGEKAKLIRPLFDHEFVDGTIELEDAEIQLKYAFTKLRRYIGDDQKWMLFKNKLSSVQNLLHILNKARLLHLNWAIEIAQSYSKAIEPGKTNLLTINNRDEFSGENFLKSPDIDPAKLMAVQNRYYEYYLRKLEKKRNDFNLGKFMKVSSEVLDRQYLNLRDQISKSLYFANEAYVTAGAVLQVVGGKQKVSRGVAPGFTSLPSFHNIAFTPYELMASIIDQLADIHKEGGRHFAEAGNQSDVGGALISCAKYIHRLMNAIKHLYVIYDLLKNAEGHELKGGYPKTIVENIQKWNKLRKLGFGLEALKKFNYDPEELENLPRTFKNKGQNKNQEDFKVGSILWLLAKKFSLTNQQLFNKFVGKRLKMNDVSKEIVLLGHFKLKISSNITINSRDTFFAYFNHIVVETLKDYYLKLLPHFKPEDIHKVDKTHFIDADGSLRETEAVIPEYSMTKLGAEDYDEDDYYSSDDFNESFPKYDPFEHLY